VTLRVYADLQNRDAVGGVRLNGVGTIEDLAREGVELKDGQSIVVYDEDLEADGVVRFSSHEGLWIAQIDWQRVRDRH
jgi:hypothetical protein